ALLAGLLDDEPCTGGVGRCGLVGQRVGGPVLHPHVAAVEVLEQQVDLGAAVEHARVGAAGAEVRGDQAAHVEGLGEQGVGDGGLIVGRVRGVGGDDDAPGGGRGGTG